MKNKLILEHNDLLACRNLYSEEMSNIEMDLNTYEFDCAKKEDMIKIVEAIEKELPFQFLTMTASKNIAEDNSDNGWDNTDPISWKEWFENYNYCFSKNYDDGYDSHVVLFNVNLIVHNEQETEKFLFGEYLWCIVYDNLPDRTNHSLALVLNIDVPPLLISNAKYGLHNQQVFINAFSNLAKVLRPVKVTYEPSIERGFWRHTKSSI